LELIWAEQRCRHVTAHLFVAETILFYSKRCPGAYRPKAECPKTGQLLFSNETTYFE
jgi:hypothetical protein